jgi:UMF1 family MFS transporter
MPAEGAPDAANGNAPPRGLLARFGLDRPELRAWALWDAANSAVVTVVIATIFPVWVQKAAAQGAAGADARFTFTTAAALAVAAVAGPFLGLLADAKPWKKRLLFLFQGVAILSTAALAFVPDGAETTALLLFALLNIGLSSAFVPYDALLPHIAAPRELDRVSTAGYAIGYVGGGICLALAFVLLENGEFFGFAGRGDASRAAFLLAAVWWAVFSVPLFRRVPEPAVVEPPLDGRPHVFRRAFGRISETYGELRKRPDAFLVMVAFLLYNDGIATIFRMAAAVGERQRIPDGTIYAAILAVQFVGIPCTFLFALLAKRFGARACILGCLAVYGVVTVLAARMSTAADFWALALLVGCVQGGAQALSRSLFASLVPKERASEFFGLFGVFEKCASVLGPLVFGLVLTHTGDIGAACLSILPFFAIGGFLLLRVNLERGRAAASQP